MFSHAYFEIWPCFCDVIGCMFGLILLCLDRGDPFYKCTCMVHNRMCLVGVQLIQIHWEVVTTPTFGNHMVNRLTGGHWLLALDQISCLTVSAIV